MWSEGTWVLVSPVWSVTLMAESLAEHRLYMILAQSQFSSLSLWFQVHSLDRSPPNYEGLVLRSREFYVTRIIYIGFLPSFRKCQLQWWCQWFWGLFSFSFIWQINRCWSQTKTWSCSAISCCCVTTTLNYNLQFLISSNMIVWCDWRFNWMDKMSKLI